MDLFSFFITSSLINNYVFLKFFGIAPITSNSKSILSSFYLGLSVLLIMIISTIITYPLYLLFSKLFNLNNISYLFIIFVNIILYKEIKTVMENKFPQLFNIIGIYFPIILFNSTIYGLLFENIYNNYNFIYGLINAFSAGFGYMLAIIMLSILRSIINENKIPVYFKGLPFNLLLIGIISMFFQILKGIFF